MRAALVLAFLLGGCATAPPPPGPPEVVAPVSLPELVRIPAGPFTMGTQAGELDEAPVHAVELPEYWIGRYLVTNREYVQYLNDPARPAFDYSPAPGVPIQAIRFDGLTYSVLPGREERPVTGLSWEMARGYCKWAGMRLPSEAEWEKAARGTDGRGYPWGNQWEAGRCNAWKRERLDVAEDLTEVPDLLSDVRAFPRGASPYGCLDMAGNAWEWCSSLYAQYPYRSDDGREDLAKPGPRVLRGGAWCEHPTFVRSTNRYRVFPDLENADRHFLASTGFRVARGEQAPPPAVDSLQRRDHPQFQLLTKVTPKESPAKMDQRYRLKPGKHRAGVILGYPLSREREVKYFIPLEHLVALTFFNWQRSSDIMEMLPIQPGQVVADIGAGSGAVSRLMSKAVGPTGQVWATDISISALKSMIRQSNDLYFFQHDSNWVSTPNTFYVLHDVEDCLLPPRSQDLIFLGLVHYFRYPRAEPGISPPATQVQAFYRSLARSLKPGGKMAIYEYTERGQHHDKQRGILKASEIVEQMEQAGFKLVSRYDAPPSVLSLFIFKLTAQASK